MNCSPISRQAALLLLGFALTAWSAGSGCKDDLDEPTLAEVTLRFVSETPGAAQGAQVWVDGEPIALNLQEETLSTVLSEGDHTIVVMKDCAEVSPAETLRVAIVGGRPATFEWRIGVLSGLQVTSEPSGLPVYLNGAPTALVTPASFGCLDPGTYEVSVHPSAGGITGFTATGDSVKTVQLGTATEEVAFDFDFVALPQKRGVLIEIFTATFCPNCPPADEAVDVLDTDPEFEPNWVAGVQLHVSWGGTDPLYNAAVDERLAVYGVDGNSAPHALFNGGQKITGSNLPDIEAAYRERVRTTYGQDAKAAIYWIDPRIEDGMLRGTLRFVAIEDIDLAAGLELHAFYGKDSLTLSDRNPFRLERIQGARAYIEPILLEGRALEAGAHRDVDVEFDYEADVLQSYVHWDSRALRLVGFVQDPATKEVLQVREVHLRAP